MSQRIDQILEVVQLVQSKHQVVQSNFHLPVPFRITKNIRLYAVEKIAAIRGIDAKTVSNKFRRELYPEVKNTDDFDRLLEVWLHTGSNALRNVLLKHTVDRQDEINIRYFFSGNKTGNHPA